MRTAERGWTEGARSDQRRTVHRSCLAAAASAGGRETAPGAGRAAPGQSASPLPATPGSGPGPWPSGVSSRIGPASIGGTLSEQLNGTRTSTAAPDQLRQLQPGGSCSSSHGPLYTHTHTHTHRAAGGPTQETWPGGGEAPAVCALRADIGIHVTLRRCLLPAARCSAAPWAAPVTNWNRSEQSRFFDVPNSALLGLIQDVCLIPQNNVWRRLPGELAHKLWPAARTRSIHGSYRLSCQRCGLYKWFRVVHHISGTHFDLGHFSTE